MGYETENTSDFRKVFQISKYIRTHVMKNIIILISAFIVCQNMLLAETNLLSNIPASFEFPPNYSLTEDFKDATDLTDGKIINDNVWFYKDGVGWHGGKYYSISFAFGSVQPVDRVRIRLSAGRSGVYWPQKIYVLASNDGENFALLDEIMSRIEDTLPPYDDKGSQVWADSISLNRRFSYLRFLVIPEAGNGYFFTDEIEAIKSDKDSLPSLEGLGTFAGRADAFLNNLHLNAIQENDLAALSRNAKLLGVDWDVSALMTELEKGGEAMLAHDKIDSNFPLNASQRRIAAENQRIFAKAGLAGLVIRPVFRYAPFNAFTCPDKIASAPAPLRLYPGERRYQAIAIANADAKTAEVAISISGDIPVTLYHVVSMMHLDHFFNANRLEQLKASNNEFHLEVLPGENSQLYVEFEAPRNAAAGKHSFSLNFSNGETLNYMVEVGHAFVMPEKLSTAFGTWDYLYNLNGKHNSQINNDNLARAQELIERNQMNNLWVDEMAMPVVRGDMFNDEELVAKLDFTKFDIWYERMGRLGQTYGIFFGLHIKEQAHFGIEPIENPELFRKRMTAYVMNVAEHLEKDLNVSPSKFFWHCQDESYSLEHEKKLAIYAEAIHESRTGFRMYSNPLMSTELADFDFPYLDILVRPCTYSYENILKYIAADARRLAPGQCFGFYSCENRTRQRDPYFYYGLPFRAGLLFREFQGICFWNFASAPQNLAEFDSIRDEFSTLYFKGNEIFSSKQFECIFEAREDYEYLMNLHRLNARLKANSSKFAAEGEKLEKDIRNEILEEFRPGMPGSFWTFPKDRTVADRQREIMWSFFEKAGE